MSDRATSDYLNRPVRSLEEAKRQRLHLRPIDEASAPKLERSFFVMQRCDGHWTAAAKILSVHVSQDEAEQEAERLHKLHSQQVFGVFPLVSEIRTRPDVTEIVRI